METLSLSTATTTMSTTCPIKTHKSLKLQAITLNPKFPNSSKSNTYRNLSLSSFSSFISCISVSTRIKAASGSISTLSAPSLGSATTDCHHWMVLMEKPPQGVNSKAEVINYYVKTLERVLGSEKDAQMCIYDASCDTNFGFCCAIDEEASRELASVPGVLTVQPDTDVESENKDYGGNSLQSSLENQAAPIKTKKLFITGLSFYTSEKTLRAAFEPFGELVEVKIIMDKISKRSKGYAFIEYTSEEAASVALKEMNGKIINGWMIVVDVAKSSPPRYGSSRPRPAA